MSWDSYVYHCLYTKDDFLKNCCESAAILSAYDGIIWASTPNFKLLSYYATIDQRTRFLNEAEELANIFKNRDAPLGIRINKLKYLMLRYNQDNQSMYFRRKKGGACMAFTEMTIVVATYNENLEVVSANGETFWQNPGLVNERVEALAFFLRSAGF